MGQLERYIQKQWDHPDQFNAATPQPQEELPFTPQDQTQQSYPVVDSANAIGSLADLLGPTPAEREAQERRMLQNKSKMQIWTGLFDGLRHLGNLYYATKGATPQTFNNPYQLVDQEYQQQRNLYNDMVNYRRQYNTSLYNLRRQLEADRRAQESHQSQMDYTKAREEALREDSRRKDEYNLARTKYYEAVANKNDEQAEYWRLRAEGVPKESAAKIAKDYAQAAKAASTGGGRSGTGNSETETVEWLDDQGNKHKKVVKRNTASPKGNTRSGSGSAKSRVSIRN